MFENLIGQGGVVERLRREIEARALPSSLLLYGPHYSGKLTAALEVARALTCDRGSAQWNCSCRGCEMQRLLVHPDTLMVGPRYFETEIPASGDVLLRTRKTAAQYLYSRAVRKLLHRFDPQLWEGNESKLSSVRTAIEEIDDRLNDLLPDRTLPAEGALTKAVKAINERCVKVAGALPDNIPIDQIRRAVSWAHTTGQGPSKVLILESADRMLDGSRNALLKILEEPPRGVYLLLTTTRRGAIIPTIQSRLRPYHLTDRSAAQSREVLEKIFREDNPAFQSLRDYFLAWNDTDVEYLRRETARFFEGVLDPQSRTGLDGELLAFLSGPQVFKPFLEELAAACGGLLTEEGGRGVAPDRLSEYSAQMRRCLLQSEQFNQSRSLLVESLFYNMRRVGREP